MIRGLTIGKYAPLHLGHLRLIETALAEVDELYVIVYNAPEHTSIPLDIRANWIKTLYPEIHVITAWDVPNEVGWTEEIQQKHENYILSLIGSIKIDAFYSSEAYGHRMSRALGSANRIVDIDRSVIDISGTLIRSNVYKHRHYLKPNVYEDHIITVGFLGDGTEKLVQNLSKLYNTPHIIVPQTQGESTDEWLAKPIYESYENVLMQANQFIFIMANHVPSLNLDLLFVKSGDDSVSSSKSTRIPEILRAMKKPYFTLKGTLEEQICYIESVLSASKKYMNLAEMIELENDIC